MANSKRQGEPLISVQELCNRTGWDPMTVFDKADHGKIPGAVWGSTLRFKQTEIEAWLTQTRSDIEDILKELEQEGRITSYIDSNGERRYIAIESKQ
jgi:excisionase family DNA binding protein